MTYNKVRTICGWFDHERAVALEKEYDKAVAEKKLQFTFEGGEYLVSFAKYLLEFLKNNQVL